MSQHDYNIANAGGAAVRSDINNALAAVQSLNSGSTAPTATKPFMPWYDTTTGALMMRNAGDTDWISMAEAVAGGATAGLHNRLINGGMQIQQRGSITATASTVYGTDRWLMQIASATGISGTFNIGGLTGSPSGFGSYIAGTWTLGRPYWAQRIESKNVRDLINKQVTVSGYISMPSGVNDTLDVRLQYATASDNFTSTTLIATNTTTSITGGSVVFFSTTFSAATMNVANIANGLEVAIFKTTNVTHATIANYVLACVQLEVGPVATPFEQRPIGMELALCQRYYQDSPTAGGADRIIFSGDVTLNGSYSGFTRFPVEMRTAPTVVLTHINASGFANISGTAGATVLGILENRVATSTVAGGAFSSIYTASAEL